MARLKKDMASAEVKKEIDDTRELATKMGIQGTPHFIVGDRIIAGAPGEPGRAARQARRATCARTAARSARRREARRRGQRSPQMPLYNSAAALSRVRES